MYTLKIIGDKLFFSTHDNKYRYLTSDVPKYFLEEIAKVEIDNNLTDKKKKKKILNILKLDYKNMNVSIPLKNNWNWVEMKTKEDFEKESNELGHCVGKPKQKYFSDSVAGKKRFFSLRSPANNCKCTIEIDLEGRKIRQIKGNSNKAIKRHLVKYVMTFIECTKGKLYDRVSESDEYLVNFRQEEKLKLR